MGRWLLFPGEIRKNRRKRKSVKITLVTVGKIKERFFEDAIAEYSKRLGRYCKLEIIQVADEKTPDGASENVERQIREKLGVQQVKLDFIGPVIGAHSGPGTVALFFLGKER